MIRALKVAGALYVVFTIGAIIVARRSSASDALGDPGRSVGGRSLTGAAKWFDLMRPGCVAADVDRRVKASPAPGGEEGVVFSAACYAVAGKTERAHELIDGLPEASRAHAVEALLNVVPPPHDGPEEEGTAPLMELLLDYQPDNARALYHAAIAEAAAGEKQAAITHLTKLVQVHTDADDLNARAKIALSRLGSR